MEGTTGQNIISYSNSSCQFSFMTQCNGGHCRTVCHQTKGYECTVKRELGYNISSIYITEIWILESVLQ
jgi:hypothetical protein